MPASASLRGVTVLVAGAGLAGLAAARDLTSMGADVTVIDARERAGGRVLTIREGFSEGQHAEAGGDMIDEAQSEIRTMCAELGLKLSKILKGGWGLVRQTASGKPRIVTRSVANGWERLTDTLADRIRLYKLGDKRWDSPIAGDIARRSVSQWLDEASADEDLRATATGMRGFFLADPDELSLLALVDQFSEEADWPWTMYRIDGGNDRLTAALAAPLGSRLRLGTELVAVAHRGQTVRASVRHRQTVSQISCDYLVLALPATTLRRVPITPALPAPQHEAIGRLKYGRAAKTLLQFSRRFWRATGKPSAYGSALPFGAVWDGNEQQRRGHAGILALLAGGSASDASQDMLARGGGRSFVDALDWLGSREAELLSVRQIVWEHDPFARGGYAFFDASFDPSLRQWLARPCDRLFFAGEHTSLRWQGYMNGAVESGRRAAAEIAATHASNSAAAQARS